MLIVNYNSAAVVGDAIRSVQAQAGISAETVVVDNASVDPSLSVLSGFGDAITVIPSDQNLGFGRGNNLAFKRARGDLIVLLNPDARFEHSSTLATAAAFMKDHLQVGLAGTTLLNLDGTPQWRPRLSYPGQRHSDVDFGQLPGRIAWVIGASMVVRREVFEAVGGFDEDYFLYAEETDLCLRIRQAGHEIGFIDDARVLHHDAYSQRETPPYEVWLKKADGLHIFFDKAYGPRVAAKLVERELWRARFRLPSLIALRKLGAGDPGKEARYRAMRDAAQIYLAR